MTSIPSIEGTITFNVPAANKACITWCKVIGSLDNITPTTPPLIVLHGGPGASHLYLTPLTSLLTGHAIPIVFYDQLGCGGSTHLSEKNGDGAFWTEDLFMNELENLLAHFGLGGAEGKPYDLLGHSWGAMLGSRFAASSRPQATNLRRFIIADSPSSMPKWVATAKKQLATLPEDVQATIKKHEDAGTFDSKEYQAAVSVFYKQFTLRVDPWPQDVIDAFSGDPTVYSTMNGPSEFIRKFETAGLGRVARTNGHQNDVTRS